MMSDSKMPTGANQPLDRRSFNTDLLAGGTALAISGLVGNNTLMASESTPKAPERLPTIFIAHGSPELAVDARRGAPFVEWGKRLSRPKAILVISAHWEKSRPVMLSSTDPKELVYDFGGFARELYAVRYDAPGAAELANRIESILPKSSVVRSNRGLDHGAWTPLVHLYPNADIPVLQISMPSHEGPQGLFDFGRALAPLREEGVLIVGSGNITHPMLELRRGIPHDIPQYAKDFDAWAAEAIEKKQYDVLMDYVTKAPEVRRNHPTPDHYLPLLVTIGAASVQNATPKFVLEEFEYNIFSRRSVEFI